MSIVKSFADFRVCPLCGAPAQHLGRTYIHEGETRFQPEPMLLSTIEEEFGGRPEQRSVKQGDRGSRVVSSKARTSTRGATDSDITTIYGVEYTHECRADLLGGIGCGLLRRTSPASEMPAECYYGGETE